MTLVHIVMTEPQPNTRRLLGDQWIALVFSVPWLDVLAQTNRLARQLWHGMVDEGMYEVLEHESTLELLDRQGKRAHFTKRQRVRYLQNNIIAYQDQGWSDGRGLLDYHCSPGTVVDKYRPGQKTFILISLRECKQRGDLDEFHITWRLRDAFVRQREQWETEINHRTKQLLIRIIFPKGRRPLRLWFEELLRKRHRLVAADELKQLADGRWQVTWDVKRPRLHERYAIKWEW